MAEDLNNSFLDVFQGLSDPRSTRNRLYSMSEILLTTLCAVICGAEGWKDIEDFGKTKVDYLRQYFPFKNGSPSDDTFRRFFRALDPKEFQELFRCWIQKLQGNFKQDVIAIDGKSSRHSFDDDKKMLHMISAYATEARLVLAQEKVSDKSNEITAIPQLLDWLDIKGSTVTIDAMGCQYQIANKILDKQGNYIFSLKGNQGTLEEDVKTYFQDAFILKTLPFYQDHDKGHGRIETRICWVSHDVAWLKETHKKWETIKSIIRIDSTREIKGKITIETRYYISSLMESPQKILAAIRSHWAIENGLHWVLDMSFGEDQSRIRKENAPQIMAVIRHISLNLLQFAKAQIKGMSIKRLKKVAGWENQILDKIIMQNFS